MLVHGVDTDYRHDQGGAGEPPVAPVAPDARTGAALGPDSGQRALLANAGFILKPDFDRPAGKLLRDCGARQLSEVSLTGIPQITGNVPNVYCKSPAVTSDVRPIPWCSGTPRSRGILRATAFGQQLALSSQTSQSFLQAR